MTKSKLPSIVLVLVIVVIAFFALQNKNVTPKQTPEQMTVQTPETEQPKEALVDESTQNTIEIANFAFAPVILTVKVGTTVTWLNKDLTGHSATADDGSFDTGILSQNESAEVTFDTPGTYAYHCTPHPNMQATIIVE